MRWSYLTAGDRVNLGRGLGMAADGSAAVRPTTARRRTRRHLGLARRRGRHLLARDLARDAVASSARTASGTSLEEDPQFRTTLTRQPSTRAWTTPDGGVLFAGLRLCIERIDLIRTSPSGRHHRQRNASRPTPAGGALLSDQLTRSSP